MAFSGSRRCRGALFLVVGESLSVRRKSGVSLVRRGVVSMLEKYGILDPW